MAGIDDIVKQLPIDDIARTLGVNRKTARAAVREGGKTILSGLHKGTQTPEGAAALSNALRRHAGEKRASSAADIDTADGASILGHIFGDEQGAVTQRLGASSALSGVDFGKLLPMLAPIIMNFIANRNGSGEQSGSGGGPDLGDLLGGLLGGGSGKGGFSLDSLGGLFGRLFGRK